MVLVHWSPNLSVGSERIDSDHKKLIDRLNRLASDLESDKGQEAIKEDLDGLIAETEEHFRREEQIMADADYPELDYHRRLHEALMQEIGLFRQEFMEGAEIGPR